MCPTIIISEIKIKVDSIPIRTLTVKKNQTPANMAAMVSHRNNSPLLPQVDFQVAATAGKSAHLMISQVIHPLTKETTGVALKMKRTAD